MNRIETKAWTDLWDAESSADGYVSWDNHARLRKGLADYVGMDDEDIDDFVDQFFLNAVFSASFSVFSGTRNHALDEFLELALRLLIAEEISAQGLRVGLGPARGPSTGVPPEVN